MNHFPWLTLLGLVPLAGTLVIAGLPRGSDELVKRVTLATALLVFVGTIAMWSSYDLGGPRFQFVQQRSWISAFGAHYAVGADGISLALIALTAALVPVVVLASWHDVDDRGRGVKTFFGLILVLETMMIGVFAATDVFLFYVFFEAMLVPMYFLIGSYGGARRSYASVKFLLYSLAGGLLMLASVVGLFVTSRDHLGQGSFDYQTLLGLHGKISGGIEDLLFLGFFIAFAIKAPLWPFHTWLPDAAAEAPTGAAVLLVGVLDKVGTFGFLRYCIPLFPHASRVFAPWILALCVIGILYGALLAVGQRDLKRLVAYTSVSHFGFIALGIFAFTSQGGTGATLYMVNHGLATGALFLLVGMLASRRGSRYIDDFGGVAKVAPWLAGAVMVVGLSSLALPGLNSWVSEFLVLVGTFTVHRAYAVLATVGIVLAALYILLVIQRTMHGPLRPDNAAFPDLSRREAWVLGPLLAALVVLGVYPKPLLDLITPSVTTTLTGVGHHDPVPPLQQQLTTSPSTVVPTPAGGAP